MPAANTNIVVRFLTRADLDPFVRAECIFWPQATHDALKELLGLPGVDVEDPTKATLALDWFAAGMDFADALPLASCPDGTTFVTFDEALVRPARRAGIAAVA